MGYIKKLKNNELVGGTDKTTVYPVTSTEAVFEEVSDGEFKSQKYLNNNITNERIVDNTIENDKLKDDTVDMGKLNTQLKTIIQNAYDASWKVKKEPFSLETKYDANDVVYDPDTNSSYVSLTADNQGNPVNPEDEGYVEGKWRIIINGISAVQATEVINETAGILEDKFDTLEGNVDEAIEGLDNRIDEIQDDLSSLTAYETAATPSYDAQTPLKNLASTAQVGYYFCTVAGSELVKQVSNATVSNVAVSQIGAFSLPPSGGHFKVKMSNAHTATSGSVTLRFGSVTATNKPLYYNGEPVSATNSWEDGEVISVYYDGTYYQASNSQGGGGKAETIKYDNSQSGLAAENVQGALDEYNVKIINDITDNQYARRTLAGEWVLNTEGTRYNVGFPVREGDRITYQSSFGNGVGVGVYDTFNHGCEGNPSYRSQLIHGATHDEISAIIEADGILVFKWSKPENAAITNEDIETIHEEFEFTLTNGSYTAGELNNKIESLGNSTGYLVHKTYTWRDCEIWFYDSNHPAEGDTDGGYKVNNQWVRINRIKIFKQIPKGAVVTASTNKGAGLSGGIWETKEQAIAQSSNNILEPTVLGWVYERTFTTHQDGWFCISLAKENPGTDYFDINSATEIYQYINALNLTIECNEPHTEQASEVKDDSYSELYIGKLLQANYSATDVIPDHNIALARAASNDLLTFPYDGIKVRFKLPQGMKAAMRYGSDSFTLAYDSGWKADGDILEIPSGNQYYRCIFCRVNENAKTTRYPLDVEEVKAMVDNGEIVLSYENYEKNDTVTRNCKAEKVIKSLANSNEYVYGLENYPKIVHISDTHGDANRVMNAYDFADAIKASYVAMTGDVACACYKHQGQYLYDIDNTHNTKTLFSIGNHDVKLVTGDGTTETLYNSFIKPLVDKYEYECDDVLYYYHDDTNYKIRFIVMSLYDEGGEAGAYYCTISSAQIEWLIETLASTPADYGVIILYHNPENHVVNEDGTFMQYGLHSTTDYGTMWNVGSGWGMQNGITYPNSETISDGEQTVTDSIRPIEDIVNGFIKKTSGSGSFKSGVRTGYVGDTVSYSFDFTNVASNLFICHMVGHTHADAIGYYRYYDGTYQGRSKQVILTVPCTQALYANGTSGILANTMDVPRGGIGATQDCFNCYVIDKENELIHIVRVGSNLAYGNRDRGYMSISYSQD